MSLETHALGWTTGRTVVLQDISLTVRPGETLGLIGPNGSGKSTLLRLMAGLLRPSTGHVELEGRPLAALPRREIAQRIAWVAQQADTSDRITARDAVELGRTPWLSANDPWSPADDAIVKGALGDVGMGDLAARQWCTLSGGERQRVHIARALAQRASVLLLDEPTNHLDVHHQLSILSLVRRLPLTSVVALHDLNHALGCDRVAVLKAGRLLALGPPREILTPELMRGVFDVCAHILTDPADGAPVLRIHPIH
ncbi:histidinol phosphatase [Cereibacter changlensis JA139]|uniref:Histidinol phosphatase n=2 Tax=Cereibacter changlensis TaxID=402884 RepID=A0A2T4JZV3_9RHOB|nr:ABC transporter ATP-binding protein [Cereibacter changlensis]PTE23406.1 histidinol phosphatase [Cereibacter changlensis JA139]PZX49745.1 iron complex transport system ATP-binding protein [Cereibacter changlensis]